MEGERFGRDAEGRFSPDALAHQIREIGREYADLRAAAELLDSQRKPMLAKLTNDARADVVANGDKCSRREAQDIAEGCAAYAAHIEATVEAQRLANIARANWEAVQSFARSIQTFEATRRAEMQFHQQRRT